MASIASISRKLVSPFGFSNGNAELTLKKPPPLVPSTLMTSCEATGKSSDAITPCEASTQREHERDRQQHAQQRASQVLPEVAERAAGERADQHDGDDEADRGGDEVLHREADHLDEAA